MYVLKDSQGNILGWQAERGERFTEFAPDDDPALLTEASRRATSAAEDSTAMNKESWR